MKLLTLIDKKVNNNIELTLDELKFLYEVNSKIDCFGYKKDPRIEEIKSKRNGRRDYSLIFNVKEEEVALSHEEWLNNPEKFKALSGNIYLRPLTSAEGLVLPQYVGGNIDLSYLASAEGLVLPQYVGGSIVLDSLTSAEGLALPQHVGRDIVLYSLTSAEGLVLPQHVGGYIDLSHLTNADGLVLPQYVGSSINLSSLTSADGLVLPQYVGYDIDLRSLTSADGLVFPHYFDLNKLKCPYNIKEEIMNNPDKYYMEPPTEDKKEIKK